MSAVLSPAIVPSRAVTQRVLCMFQRAGIEQNLDCFAARAALCITISGVLIGLQAQHFVQS